MNIVDKADRDGLDVCCEESGSGYEVPKEKEMDQRRDGRKQLENIRG